MAADEVQQALGANRERVDGASESWQQGDVFRFDQLGTVVLADLDVPLTQASLAAAYAADRADRITAVWHDNDEYAVISQDCDIVGPSLDDPYVKVCPIVALPEEQARLASQGWMPGFAPVPALGSDKFVDVSRVVTVEKSMLLNATLVARLRDAEEARQFRGVVHRHFSRPAFPDELQHVIRPLMDRFRERRNRQSPEGRAIRAVREIRVAAYPGWDAPEVEVVVLLLCYRADYASIANTGETPSPDELWLERKDRWTGICTSGLPTAAPKIKSVGLFVELLEEMTAAEYLDSDTVDLGGMSPQRD